MKKEKYSSWISYSVKKLSILLVCLMQDLPLTPNMLTIASAAFVLAAVSSLLFFHSRILFSIFSLLTFSFDQVDGIWARVKGQSTVFGHFFDGFMDSVKFFVIDLGLILYTYDRLLAFAGDARVLVAFFSAYFAAREWYTASATPGDVKTFPAGARPLGLTSSAARFVIIFPLIVYVPVLAIPYFLGSFALHMVKACGFLLQRYRQGDTQGTV